MPNSLVAPPPPDIPAIKRVVRHHLVERRKALSKEERDRANALICNQLMNSPILARAKVVMAYSSITAEVDVTPVIEELLSRGVTVWLPKVLGPGKMTGLPIMSMADTVVSSLGINEPSGGRDLFFNQPDVVLVPGTGFDISCNRIGLGQGFYDQYLAGLGKGSSQRPLRIGVAYQTQIVQVLPVEQTDQPMDFVVTEAQLYRRAG